ncbi:MAG: type II toxin-antitoxin system HicB family antitoxin [Methanosarcinales archaeon]|nr:type II toxin-antitoxin system HicB family antitoxin [Methanosarcinales archaeon]
MKFNVVIGEGDGGWYAIKYPSSSGCILWGKTVAGALENIKEAIEIDLEPEDGIKKVIFCC